MNNRLRTAAAILLLAVLGGCATFSRPSMPTLNTAQASGFLYQSMVVDGKPRLYAVYVPPNYDPARPWPLILYLHGKGERGDQGLLPTDVGLGHAIRCNPERFPAIVVFPQCPDDVLWDKALNDIDLALAQTLRGYSIDRSRVYLTGISMGGYATWIYGARHADLFAALMPVAGGGRLEDVPALAGLPIWAFHGAEDTRVPVDESRRMVEAVKRAGGNVRYTEFPKAGHQCWNEVYEDPKVVKWLFRQHKSK